MSSQCPFHSSKNINSTIANNLFIPDSNLEIIINTVLYGLIFIDSSGIIRAFNDAAVKIFGYTSEEVLGCNVTILMPEPYCSEHNDYIANFLTTKQKKIIGIGREISGKRKNGDVFPMDISINQMIIDDNIMFVGTMRDISNRKKAEKDLLSHILALKNSNQALDDFAYIASHDLKEPLRGISNNASFLKEDHQESLDEDATKRIDRILFLCKKMEHLINDLLYFAKIDHQELAIQETDLNNVLENIISIIETNVKFLIPRKLPTITCETIRVTEVFRNLISNAIKYNDKKEKIIEIGYQEKEESGLNYYIFYVKDNGIGIKEKYYNDIFRIFKRLNEQNELCDGTGVGLTFVKKIIEHHGGKIWLESQINIGTTFYFTLTENT